MSATERARRKIAKQGERIRQLEAENAELRARVEKLERLVAVLRKDSSTSSKSPSSDIVKPPRKSEARGTKPTKRKIGGQPGHPRHERQPFAPDGIDQFLDFVPSYCPCCGKELVPCDHPPGVLQQAELEEKPFHVREYSSYAGWCESCERVHYASLPAEIKRAGLVGPRLTALIAYMKGKCHASFSTVRKFLRDIVGLTISRGQIRKLIAKASESLIPAYEELRNRLPLEAHLNVDETGHKENGDKFWTWCFRAEVYTFFRIDKSRGSDVLLEVLGEEFGGVLGCDYFSAYRKYMGDHNIIVQFCFAHLIRDVRFLTKLADKVTKNYGERVLGKIRELFKVIHRRERMREDRFEAKLKKARDELLKTAKSAPSRSEAHNLAKRFRDHGDAYFQFITTPGIEPTNNLAEQAIRFVVIDRKVTQGTRSPVGREWCERIWTVIATCAQQGRSAFEFIYQSIVAHFEGRAGPSLLPNTS